jgi:hypothetical protein
VRFSSLCSLGYLGSRQVRRSILRRVHYPFDAIKVHQAIDDACDTEGSEPDTGHKLQNRVKNDFCVTGPAVRLTATMFRRLQEIIDQKAADGEVKYGNRKDLPISRTVFVGTL